jgi:Uma2 family endonuclease
MYTLKLAPIINLTQDTFYRVCQANPELKLELNARGELIVMPPTGGETGRANSHLNGQIWLWNEEKQAGECFDSSTGFILPNQANRSPDAAWIKKSRWESLSLEQRKKFIPLCPDFVVEISSPSENIIILRAKMEEYINNGCRLGWLLNRQEQQVEIYRPARVPEILDKPTYLDGEKVLEGFKLSLQKIW